MGENRDRGQAGVDACAVPISVGGIIVIYFTGYLPCELPRKGGEGPAIRREGWLRAIEKVTRPLFENGTVGEQKGQPWRRLRDPT